MVTGLQAVNTVMAKREHNGNEIGAIPPWHKACPWIRFGRREDAVSTVGWIGGAPRACVAACHGETVCH